MSDETNLGVEKCIPFKLFGLQRTCTNLVRYALIRNFHVASLERGMEWKHGFIKKVDTLKRNDEPVRVVVCVRNPYAWLSSCYRYFCRCKETDGTVCRRFHRGQTFVAFVVSPHYRWRTPIDRWNELNAHWLQWVNAHPQQGIVVRSEDLMGRNAQAGQLRRIGDHFRLRQRGDELLTYDRRVTETFSLVKEKMAFDYYLQEQYWKDYSAELAEFVNGRLDWALMARLGYQAPATHDAVSAT